MSAAVQGRTGGFLAGGLLAVVATVAVTTAACALARAAGVGLVVDGGRIPTSGVASLTGILALVGVVLALAFRRWSADPARAFTRTAVALTLVSLVPPFVVDATFPTALTLAALHVVAAAVMIPALARLLR